MIDNIKWLGHASFCIEAEKIVYFDPWKLKQNLPEADIVLISHDHYDHCSVEDINKISKKETVVVCNKSCASHFTDVEVKIVKPNEKMNVNGIDIEIFPAYNIHKPYHPKTSGGLGFIVTLSGQRIYHCGDTDFIPEMKDIKCDIALLTVSGTYVMTASEAAKAVEIIKPKIAIPMHFGDIVGTRKDAEEFVRLCQNLSIEAKIINKM